MTGFCIAATILIILFSVSLLCTHEAYQVIDKGLNKHSKDNNAHASQQQQEHGNDTKIGMDRLAYPALESANIDDSDIHFTAKGSFPPIRELSPEMNLTETSDENSVAEKASQSTQLAIEKMVNPSSLLSSAIEDIRQSGEGNATDLPIGANPPSPSPSFSPSFLGQDVGFSTIHLYGKIIQAKDFLIISANEEAGSEIGIYVMARIPCDDSQNTLLKFIILENWTSIAYPLPEMHLVEGVPNGELCMFRFEYPESEDSDILRDSINGSNDGATSTMAVALYNSGASSIKFPKTASITLSYIRSQ